MMAMPVTPVMSLTTWHVLDRVRGVGDEHRALAEVAAQHADLVVGPERGRQPPERVPRLDPLAVADVGLSAGHALELPRVDQLDLEAARAEELEERDPVHAGGLHRHGLDAAAGEPVSQGVEIRGEGAEGADVAALGVAALRHGDVVARGSDIDAGGIQVDAAKLRGKLGVADTTMSRGTRSRHAVLLTRGNRRGHAGRGGADVRILPNGITPRAEAVASDIAALLRDHAMKRAARTNDASAFSTRHVRRDST